MKTLPYFFIIAFIVLSTPLFAQTVFSGQIKAEYVPFSNYVRPIDSVKTGSTSDFKRIQAAFNVPVSVKIDAAGRPTMWAIAMEGSYARINNRNYEQTLFPTELLNVQVGLMHSRPISKTWSIMAMASIGVYTDMEKISSKDFLAQGGVLFIKHFKPNLALGFGPVLSNTFGVPMILPAIYFDWTTQGRYKLHVNFPQGIEFGVKLSKAVDLNAVVELSGMTAEVNRNNTSMLLGYQQIIAGLRPEFKLSKSLSLQLTGGTTLTRSFSLSSRRLKDFFKKKDEANPRFTTTAYGAATLKWNFSKH
ncbi:DUF6268 family outer membrane beta-barrel protein [Pedobacter nototheniae]|uniref:DUF6268 family outer membrane beta-barrel protein n=1 Tax=Pedobacter nototheniae TaxID=2488994 RepID=UPI002930975E|nr:DUF6268 family outer membrane beta-barrel protein [Pedobacter nototheniae]